jgi:hypothetical protein
MGGGRKKRGEGGGRGEKGHKRLEGEMDDGKGSKRGDS